MSGTDAAAMSEARAAKRQAAYEAWKARVNEVLMLHIGLIDEELCEQTARFLAGEAWLIDGKPELENRHVLLIAKAVGYENRRDGLDYSAVTRFETIDHTRGLASISPDSVRAVVVYGASVKPVLQDDGRTLKVFLTDPAKETDRESAVMAAREEDR